MRTILIKNLTIQFDSFDDGADKHNALDMIDDINELLQKYFSDSQPQILSSAIDDDDIEITLPEDERNELIEKIMEHDFGTDKDKYYASNRAFLESKSDEELLQMRDLD